MLSIHDGEIRARENDVDAAGTFTVDGLVADASVTHYDALLLPGGTVNPDHFRVDPDAVSFVREFVESGKPDAAICHGPWTLIEAGVVEGRGPPPSFGPVAVRVVGFRLMGALPSVVDGCEVAER